MVSPYGRAVDVLAVPPVANVALFSRKNNQNPINKTFSDDHLFELAQMFLFALQDSKLMQKKSEE